MTIYLRFFSQWKPENVCLPLVLMSVRSFLCQKSQLEVTMKFTRLAWNFMWLLCSHPCLGNNFLEELGTIFQGHKRHPILDLSIFCCFSLMWFLSLKEQGVPDSSRRVCSTFPMAAVTPPGNSLFRWWILTTRSSSFLATITLKKVWLSTSLVGLHILLKCYCCWTFFFVFGFWVWVLKENVSSMDCIYNSDKLNIFLSKASMKVCTHLWFGWSFEAFFCDSFRYLHFRIFQ